MYLFNSFTFNHLPVPCSSSILPLLYYLCRLHKTSTCLTHLHSFTCSLFLCHLAVFTLRKTLPAWHILTVNHSPVPRSFNFSDGLCHPLPPYYRLFSPLRYVPCIKPYPLDSHSPVITHLFPALIFSHTCADEAPHSPSLASPPR